MKKIQTQEQIQLTAHQKKLVFSTFHNTMEALEEYIEKAGHYPDFKNKKQIFKESINDPNRTSAELADDFLAQLFCFKGIINKKPEFLRKEVQEEYYKWVSAVGIDVNNCPKELKNYLFEINEILEGKGEKIVEQTRQLINDGVENDPKDMLKVFKAFQVPINKNREQGKLLESKTHKDIEIESKFSGSMEQGQEAFRRIAGTVSNYGDVRFFPQQGQQQKTNSEIIQDIRQNPRNWRVDEIITEFDNFGRTNQETVLIHQSARLDDYDQRTGKLNFAENPIYQASRFNSQEIAEIQQALNISQQPAQVQQPPYKWNF